MDEIQQLRNRFTADMYEGVRILAREHGYNATRFVEMVRSTDGVSAARALLHTGPSTSYGFEVLWEKGQLGRSVEAWTLRPEYEPLFTEDEREIARRRLELHDFDVDGYLRRLASER
ncbi:hypothetical protein [Kribbella swartbergensis]